MVDHKERGVGEGAAAMAARRGDGAEWSLMTSLTRGRRRPPGGPAGPARPDEMERRRSACRPKAMGHTGFE
jgi:hypothetical protein